MAHMVLARLDALLILLSTRTPDAQYYLHLLQQDAGLLRSIPACKGKKEQEETRYPQQNMQLNQKSFFYINCNGSIRPKQYVLLNEVMDG